MTTATAVDPNLVKADIFRILSLGFSYPNSETIETLIGIAFEVLDSNIPDKKTIKAITDILNSVDSDDNKDEYSRLFIRKTVPLSESSNCSNFDALADVGAFYRAFGMNPKSGDAPDALNYELEFMALLLVKYSIATTSEQKKITKSAYDKFLKDHLSDFNTKFVEKLNSSNPTNYYSSLGKLMDLLIKSETKK